MDFLVLAQQCAPSVHPQTMANVVRVESGFNPFAIGVVGGHLVRQPTNKAEALATAKSLEQSGFNFSLGLGQVNRYNLSRYGLDYETAFEPCDNLKAGAAILSACFAGAKKTLVSDQAALQAAFSCYYSGNYLTGFRSDFNGQPSYVQKVLNGAGGVARVVTPPIAVIKTARMPTRGVKAADRFSATLEEAGESAAVYGGSDRSVMVFR